MPVRMITAFFLFSFFYFSFIPANNSDADGSVAHRPDPRKLETQCVPAVGECRLKKRRRTGGSDSTFDEARDITFEEEEDDSSDDGSDEPQDTLCTLCGVSQSGVLHRNCLGFNASFAHYLGI